MEIIETQVSGVCLLQDTSTLMLFIEKHNRHLSYKTEIVLGRQILPGGLMVDGAMYFSFTMLEPTQEQIDWLYVQTEACEIDCTRSEAHRIP